MVWLRLHYNRLTVLPEGLGQLTLLIHMNLGHRKLCALSASMQRLASLENISANYKHFVTSP